MRATLYFFALVMVLGSIAGCGDMLELFDSKTLAYSVLLGGLAQATIFAALALVLDRLDELRAEPLPEPEPVEIEPVDDAYSPRGM